MFSLVLATKTWLLWFLKKTLPQNENLSPDCASLIRVVDLLNNSNFHAFRPNQTNKWSQICPSLNNDHRAENKWFSTLKRTKTDDTQPKLNVVCFVVQSCLTDADFVIPSNYCLISTREKTSVFTAPFIMPVKAFLNQRFCCLTMRRKRHNCRSSLYTCLFCGV